MKKTHQFVSYDHWRPKPKKREEILATLRFQLAVKFGSEFLGVLLGGLVVLFSEGKCYQKLERIPNISRVCKIADKHVTFLIQELF